MCGITPTFNQQSPWMRDCWVFTIFENRESVCVCVDWLSQNENEKGWNISILFFSSFLFFSFLFFSFLWTRPTPTSQFYQKEEEKMTESCLIEWMIEYHLLLLFFFFFFFSSFWCWRMKSSTHSLTWWIIFPSTETIKK